MAGAKREEGERDKERSPQFLSLLPFHLSTPATQGIQINTAIINILIYKVTNISYTIN